MSFTLTILWNLAKLVKTYPGIIVRQHLTVQRQMVLLKERYAELRKELQQDCRNEVWMKNGERISWGLLLSAKCSRSLVRWENIL